MKTLAKTATALALSVSLLAPAANAQETSWTGGHPLPPGTQVPFEPGYATQWLSYDVVKFGDPNYRNADVQGVRVLGRYDQNSILCLENAKGGMWGCYVNGEQAIDLGYAQYGRVLTVDPVVSFFAPVIRFIVSPRSYLNNLSS